MRIEEINSVPEKVHDEEEILPSYDTIEGGGMNDNGHDEGDEILQFGNMSTNKQGGTKFDIKLDENSNMSWKQPEIATASTDNGGSNENKWDIDISLDDQKQNVPEVKTAKFTINGQEQKYLLC